MNPGSIPAMCGNPGYFTSCMERKGTGKPLLCGKGKSLPSVFHTYILDDTVTLKPSNF